MIFRKRDTFLQFFFQIVYNSGLEDLVKIESFVLLIKSFRKRKTSSTDLAQQSSPILYPGFLNKWQNIILLREKK